MTKTHITSSAVETQDLAKKLAKSLHLGTTITLTGQLGAGKTTFTQGFGQYFGIDRMTSPTYNLIKEYTPKKNTLLDIDQRPISPWLKKIFHIDLYRLASPEEISKLGLSELWSNPKNILLIEWPEKIDQLPENNLQIKFEKLSENKRRITL